MSGQHSHRFEVVGHCRHVVTQGTRAKPENMVPCTKHEACRREWVPPHVKGPEDKPLFPKRREL